PVSLDLEQVHSAAEFAEQVCRKVQDRLTFWSRQGHRLKNFFESLRGGEVGGVKFPEKKDRPDGYWKALLTEAIEKLVWQQTAAGKRVVFLFDEMPWMLAAIADPQRDGPQTAMEVLDVLRGLRQSPATGHGFRMVLCGSIGLHHLLGALKQYGYRNQPVNDIRVVEVPTLEPPAAPELASRLLSGEGLTCDTDVPGTIAAQTGGFPYYVHWVVSELRMGGRPVTADDIDLIVRRLLTAPHDPCNLRQFK